MIRNKYMPVRELLPKENCHNEVIEPIVLGIAPRLINDKVEVKKIE